MNLDKKRLLLFVYIFVCHLVELPRLDVSGDMETKHYSLPHCVSHNGFLFKTGSMARAPERKAREGNHRHPAHSTLYIRLGLRS